MSWEKQVFLLGQWRNFDDLEECLTLDELIEIHNAMIDRDNKRMEFEARLAGAEMPDEPQTDSLADRIRARKEQGERKEFSHGVGYQTIGG